MISISVFCFCYLCHGGYMFIGICLFVYQQDYTSWWIFTEFGQNVAHGPRVKPLDFGGNPDHVTSGLGPGMMRAALRLGGGTAIRCTGGYVLSGVCSIATICNFSLDRGMHSTTCHSSYFPCLAPCSTGRLNHPSVLECILCKILYCIYSIVLYHIAVIKLLFLYPHMMLKTVTKAKLIISTTSSVSSIISCGFPAAGVLLPVLQLLTGSSAWRIYTVLPVPSLTPKVTSHDCASKKIYHFHPFSAVTLLVGWQEQHPACKNLA